MISRKKNRYAYKTKIITLSINTIKALKPPQQKTEQETNNKKKLPAIMHNEKHN